MALNVWEEYNGQVTGIMNSAPLPPTTYGPFRYFRKDGMMPHGWCRHVVGVGAEERIKVAQQLWLPAFIPFPTISSSRHHTWKAT